MGGQIAKQHIIQGVPHLCQYRDVTNSKWQSRACGITALAMVIQYWQKTNTPTPDALIEEGLQREGYRENVGWRHQQLVALAHAHNCFGYAEDFTSVSDEMVEKVTTMIATGVPVIISVRHRPPRQGTHLLVLVGYESGSSQTPSAWYLHDPEKEEGYYRLSWQDGQEYFRPLTLFIYGRM